MLNVALRSSQRTEYWLRTGGRELPLRERTVVGRDPDCDVWLGEDGLVSRRHARLTVCAHGVVIEDLGSRNGVYVDGDRVSSSRLVVGGESIRVGATDLRLTVAPQQDQDPERWDDETAAPGRARTRGLAAVTEGADMFTVLATLAEKALLGGDVSCAARIVEGHFARLLEDARSAGGPDSSKVALATSLSMRMVEAGAEARWIEYVLDLHGATGAVPDAQTVDRLYELVRRVRGLSYAAIGRYVAAMSERDLTPNERFRLRRIEGLAQRPRSP
jgi:pSer/pThr/pTyr-binding forkhead associated (FHA) protein